MNITELLLIMPIEHADDVAFEYAGEQAYEYADALIAIVAQPWREWNWPDGGQEDGCRRCPCCSACLRCGDHYPPATYANGEPLERDPCAWLIAARALGIA